MGMSVERLLRLLTIRELGGKCINCGNVDLRVLQLNHVNGKFKNEKLYKLCLGVLWDKNESLKKHLEVRCANCNVWGVGHGGRRQELRLQEEGHLVPAPDRAPRRRDWWRVDW